MTRFRASAALLCGALVAVASDAFARIVPPPPPPAPVTLHMTGTKTIRARLSVGVGLPCDSTLNTKLYDDKVKPGFAQTWMASSYCFCIEHTTETFPDTEWVDAKIVCRPVLHNDAGFIVDRNLPIDVVVPD